MLKLDKNKAKDVENFNLFCSIRYKSGALERKSSIVRTSKYWTLIFKVP